MNKRRGKNEKSVLQMPLGKPIEKTMVRTIQRVLAIICIESVLLAGVQVFTYVSTLNKDSVREYAAGIDKTMQTKVTMIKSVVSAIDSGTLTEKDEILAYVDEMVRRGADKAVSMKDANSGRYASLMKGNQKGKIILDYKGGFKFATSYISEVTGWRIVGIKPLHKLLLFLLMIVLVNVGLCLIIVQITRRISNNRISVLFAPLESISQKVLKIAEGNLDITFDEEQNSVEITNLTNSLNDTIQSLKYYMESIANIDKVVLYGKEKGLDGRGKESVLYGRRRVVCRAW